MSKARTSQTNSDQSKTSTVEMRKSSTVETKKISQVEAAKTTENGDTCHKVSTVETHQISKVEAHNNIFDKDNETLNSPALDSHQSDSDTHNDITLANPASSLKTNNDHQKLPLKNQI